jgi:hypothetical protein
VAFFIQSLSVITKETHASLAHPSALPSPLAGRSTIVPLKQYCTEGVAPGLTTPIHAAYFLMQPTAGAPASGRWSDFWMYQGTAT